MTVPTVLAITARRSWALCSASDRPAGEISAVVIGPLPFSVLSWRLAQAAGTPIGAMLSAAAEKGTARGAGFQADNRTTAASIAARSGIAACAPCARQASPAAALAWRNA